jgi:hypothetical protein
VRSNALYKRLYRVRLLRIIIIVGRRVCDVHSASITYIQYPLGCSFILLYICLRWSQQSACVIQDVVVVIPIPTSLGKRTISIWAAALYFIHHNHPKLVRLYYLRA